VSSQERELGRDGERLKKHTGFLGLPQQITTNIVEA
jgi:hypothetical protein